MKKAFYLIMGILLGGFVGSALGFLFAPTSGLETRENLSNYFINFRDEVKQAALDKRQVLEEQLKKLQSGKE